MLVTCDIVDSGTAIYELDSLLEYITSIASTGVKFLFLRVQVVLHLEVPGEYPPYFLAVKLVNLRMAAVRSTHLFESILNLHKVH